MPATMASLGIESLPPEELRALAYEILDRTEPQPGRTYSPAFLEELRRRVADAEANPDDWVTWEEALATAKKRAGL